MHGAFRALHEIFWEQYIQSIQDVELNRVIQPFYAWRALVLAHPGWYPNLDSETRQKLFIFIENVLDADWFYRTLSYIGKLLEQNGVNTIISATAHRRIYRLRAREDLPDLIEVFVRCSVKTCIARDHKGIYDKAMSGGAKTVPGVQELYEEPKAPAIIVDTEEESPLECVQKIVSRLVDFEVIAGGKDLLSLNM